MKKIYVYITWKNTQISDVCHKQKMHTSVLINQSSYVTLGLNLTVTSQS